MILIADSGSTNTDWALMEKGKGSVFFSTPGINPFFHSSDKIAKILQKHFASKISSDEISEIHFYGAGCSSKELCTVVSKGLKKAFPKAKPYVNHDLLAAVRVTCGNNPGIACILGTGSNSCLYDGNKIIDNIASLGYVLGDEGSAAYFGKELVRSYLYREFPDDLKEVFESTFLLSRETVLNNVYEEDMPNTYLANFALFLSISKNHDYIQKLIIAGFSAFFKHHVSKYEHFPSYNVHFVGAIAFHFKKFLVEAAKEYKITIGKVIGKPIDELSKYHLRN